MDYEVCNKVAIFCFGNYYLCDDGFAIHLSRTFKNSALPDFVEVYEFGLLGLSLIDVIQPYRKLFILDALKGIGKPGRVFRFDLLNNPPQVRRSMISAHDFGVMEVLDVVKALCPKKLPQEVIVWGVEAEITDQYGTTLSPLVKKALFTIKEQILMELETSV